MPRLEPRAIFQRTRPGFCNRGNFQGAATALVRLQEPQYQRTTPRTAAPSVFLPQLLVAQFATSHVCDCSCIDDSQGALIGVQTLTACKRPPDAARQIHLSN